MNTDQATSIINTVTHSGWGIAFLTGTWSIFLRFVIGRHSRATDRLERRLSSMEGRLTAIETRLTVIESRSHYRRREDSR